MYIDDEEIDDWSFSGQSDWNTYFNHDVKDVEIAEGAHVLKFEVVRGPMNIDRFTFTRTGELSGMDETRWQHPSAEFVSVYSIDGRPVRGRVAAKSALDGLGSLLYKYWAGACFCAPVFSMAGRTIMLQLEKFEYFCNCLRFSCIK